MHLSATHPADHSDPRAARLHTFNFAQSVLRLGDVELLRQLRHATRCKGSEMRRSGKAFAVQVQNNKALSSTTTYMLSIYPRALNRTEPAMTSALRGREGWREGGMEGGREGGMEGGEETCEIVFAWVEDTAESPGDYYRPLQLFSLEGMERMEGMTLAHKGSVSHSGHKVIR
ncbi:hypothetical protein EYF80_022768 [Liparis tanakae]|uniref:Uncharacterized protein n=1 Tax=Liparis tanakae TaxID=230148 RepID=A0A4Z2HP06_9TELE|nr:hypothetical protein EYF80_022768 [Liparis tanakae]